MSLSYTICLLYVHLLVLVATVVLATSTEERFSGIQLLPYIINSLSDKDEMEERKPIQAETYLASINKSMRAN